MTSTTPNRYELSPYPTAEDGYGELLVSLDPSPPVPGGDRFWNVDLTWTDPARGTVPGLFTLLLLIPDYYDAHAVAALALEHITTLGGFSAEEQLRWRDEHATAVGALRHHGRNDGEDLEHLFIR